MPRRGSGVNRLDLSASATCQFLLPNFSPFQAFKDIALNPTKLFPVGRKSAASFPENG